MRVAVIISGALRSFKTCYPNFKRFVLEPNGLPPVAKSDPKEGENSPIGAGVDVYFHTHKMKLPYAKVQVADEGSYEEAVALYKPVVSKQEIYDQKLRDRLYEESGAARFQQEVRSMKLKARKDGRWGHHTRCDNCGKLGYYSLKCRICGGKDNIHNIVAMLYSVRESYRLIPNPSDYTAIVRARFDVWHKSPLKIGLIAPMKLYLPDNAEKDFIDYSVGTRSPNDQLAISSPAVMAAYCSQYDNFYDLAMTGIRLGCGIGAPHLSIKTLADNAGIQLVDFSHKYCLERKK